MNNKEQKLQKFWDSLSDEQKQFFVRKAMADLGRRSYKSRIKHYGAEKVREMLSRAHRKKC